MPFSVKSLEFLFENRMHDSKAWFDENRGLYNTQVLEPMKELVKALAPAMLQVDPRFIVEPAVGKTISRVRRDTRFSADKMLYRDNVWCTFGRDKKLWEGMPCFFFELNQKGFLYGCGYYQASKEAMDAFREMILSGDAVFKKAFDAFHKQKVFTAGGDRYKRTKYPEQPEELRDWLDRKSIYFEAVSKDFNLLFSDGLADKLSKELLLLKPVYEFLCTAEERKAR
jgi:uncharacterized protein (TIGR02453 family)